jgi:hypothetical protein
VQNDFVSDFGLFRLHSLLVELDPTQQDANISWYWRTAPEWPAGSQSEFDSVARARISARLGKPSLQPQAFKPPAQPLQGSAWGDSVRIEHVRGIHWRLKCNCGQKFVRSLNDTIPEHQRKCGTCVLSDELSATKKEVIARLDAALAALGSLSSNGSVRHIMSAAARRRISVAQKARWAKQKSGRPKRTIPAAGRKRIAAAQRARWAKVKREEKAA